MQWSKNQRFPVRFQWGIYSEFPVTFQWTISHEFLRFKITEFPFKIRWSKYQNLQSHSNGKCSVNRPCCSTDRSNRMLNSRSLISPRIYWAEYRSPVSWLMHFSAIRRAILSFISSICCRFFLRDRLEWEECVDGADDVEISETLGRGLVLCDVLGKLVRFEVCWARMCRISSSWLWCTIGRVPAVPNAVIHWWAASSIGMAPSTVVVPELITSSWW